jgi:hypothetical protein
MICRTVGTVHNNAGMTRLEPAAEWAGYLGIVPLIACLVGLGLLPGYAGRELAQRGAIAWGAVLLAFVGAVHLGLSLAGRLQWESVRVLGALAPALIGAAAILLGGQRALALLVVGHGVLWLYEHRSLGARLPPAYLAMRRALSLATCILLALTMFISDQAGLR